jgi:hypothetical protein
METSFLFLGTGYDTVPGATSPLIDVTTPPCRIMHPSYEVKMSSLPLLHLPVMLHPIVSPLELKSKHGIRTTNAASHPPQTARLPPSTAIERSSQPWPLPATQPRLHFASSLARAPCHWSSTCYYCSLSLPSHAHHPSEQQHLW